MIVSDRRPLGGGIGWIPITQCYRAIALGQLAGQRAHPGDLAAAGQRHRGYGSAKPVWAGSSQFGRFAGLSFVHGRRDYICGHGTPSD